MRSLIRGGSKMHYFNVETNLCSRFTIGYPSEPDNFSLSGETRGSKPFVSCHILDKNGDFLYGMRDNNLTPESSHFRLTLTKEGWHRIINAVGNELLLIETIKDNSGNDITSIRGEFYDKAGKLAARGDERGLMVSCPLRMG